jgi:hypothetical protein
MTSTLASPRQARWTDPSLNGRDDSPVASLALAEPPLRLPGSQELPTQVVSSH